jgi:hypothetical protein
MKRETNIFDKIGTLISGYKGYQERDSRRECDRQLKELIANKLSETEKTFTSIKKKHSSKFLNNDVIIQNIIET